MSSFVGLRLEERVIINKVSVGKRSNVGEWSSIGCMFFDQIHEFPTIFQVLIYVMGYYFFIRAL